MIKEFEGKTEKDAIDRAALELGIESDRFDVEIVESQKSGFLFKKGKVKIRVHLDDREGSETEEPGVFIENGQSDSEFEKKMLAFVKAIIEKMGYHCSVSVLFREENKIGMKIESDHSAILIGKKGKNLDALQLIANVYAGRIGKEDIRIILDTENYRIRREEFLVRLAYETADNVRSSRNSVLLEPMNPFERRIIHTTLNDINDIETQSEGEGLYKQVRVFYRGK
jgi:spoIIIJ-associated protein